MTAKRATKKLAVPAISMDEQCDEHLDQINDNLNGLFCELYCCAQTFEQSASVVQCEEAARAETALWRAVDRLDILRGELETWRMAKARSAVRAA